MSVRKISLALLAAAAFAVVPASANAASDDVGYRAILAHDWPTAERQLLAGLEKDPMNVFRQLNLAWVYSQTGRKTEAAAIYQKILNSNQNQFAELPSREGASVKALAERGLAMVQSSN